MDFLKLKRATSKCRTDHLDLGRTTRKRDGLSMEGTGLVTAMCNKNRPIDISIESADFLKISRDHN